MKVFLIGVAMLTTIAAAFLGVAFIVGDWKNLVEGFKIAGVVGTIFLTILAWGCFGSPGEGRDD